QSRCTHKSVHHVAACDLRMHLGGPSCHRDIVPCRDRHSKCLHLEAGKQTALTGSWTSFSSGFGPICCFLSWRFLGLLVETREPCSCAVVLPHIRRARTADRRGAWPRWL